jgi:hypothetical protein
MAVASPRLPFINQTSGFSGFIRVAPTAASGSSGNPHRVHLQFPWAQVLLTDRGRNAQCRRGNAESAGLIPAFPQAGIAFVDKCRNEEMSVLTAAGRS